MCAPSRSYSMEDSPWPREGRIELKDWRSTKRTYSNAQTAFASKGRIPGVGQGSRYGPSARGTDCTKKTYETSPPNSIVTIEITYVSYNGTPYNDKMCRDTFYLDDVYNGDFLQWRGLQWWCFTRAMCYDNEFDNHKFDNDQFHNDAFLNTFS